MATDSEREAQRFRAREFVLPALLFAALAVLLFLPQLRDINGLLHGGSDGFNRAWRIWWFSGGFREWGDTLWYSRSVFYPTGHALSAAELSPLNMLPAILLSFVFGPIGGYNLTMLLSFVTAGLAAYAYAR
ncbi:MAG: hypothetical protein U1E22_10870, partial [Coriobacteriia bacterium]|nr:hypothetical protein [Coriobacteriia bacterium]